MSASDAVDAAIDDVARHLVDGNDFLFTTHMTPDGDGIGSQLALLRFLKARGKRVKILNCSSVPEDLRFLARSGEITTFHRDKHLGLVAEAASIVAFDLGGSGRLGRMEQPVREAEGEKVLIDHHLFDDKLFDLELIDPDASSSAELTYQVIRSAGGDLDLSLAEPLYVGIVQDTGSFNYNNTSRLTHEIAGACLDAGVNPHRIWKKLNCQKPFRRVRLMGQNIGRITLSCRGRLASVKVDLEYLKQNDGEVRDAFEVVNHFLTIQGVEVGMLALQIGSQRTKFSLRSAGRCDVCAVAKEHTGGGHRYASGFTVEGMEIEAAYQMMLQRLHLLIERESPQRNGS